MLVSFSVRNFGCFRDGATLEMSPGRSRGQADHVRGDLLTSAAVHGPCGSGKSMLVDAFRMLKGLTTDPTHHRSGTVHCWDSDSDVSVFELVVRIGGMDYRYTLSVRPDASDSIVTFDTVYESLSVSDPSRIPGSDGGQDEDLILERRPGGSDGRRLRRLLAERRGIETSLTDLMARRTMASRETASVYIEDGEIAVMSPMADDETLAAIDREIADVRTALASVTEKIRDEAGRRESLPITLEGIGRSRGLSVSRRFSSDAGEIVERLRGWLSGSLTVIGEDDVFIDPEGTEALSRILGSMDLGISGVGWSPVGGRMSEELRPELDTGILERLDSGEVAVFRKDRDILRAERLPDGGIAFSRLTTVHGHTPWPLSWESDGTLKTVSIASVLIPTDEDRVFVIDEMDSRMHPDLVRRIVELFREDPSPSKQLILTAHDTGIMTTSLFRRDELWMLDRNNDGISLVSLDTVPFKGRLENAYLSGRLPGTPLIERGFRWGGPTYPHRGGCISGGTCSSFARAGGPRGTTCPDSRPQTGNPEGSCSSRSPRTGSTGTGPTG